MEPLAVSRRMAASTACKPGLQILPRRSDAIGAGWKQRTHHYPVVEVGGWRPERVYLLEDDPHVALVQRECMTPHVEHGLQASAMMWLPTRRRSGSVTEA